MTKYLRLAPFVIRKLSETCGFIIICVTAWPLELGKEIDGGLKSLIVHFV